MEVSATSTLRGKSRWPPPEDRAQTPASDAVTAGDAEIVVRTDTVEPATVLESPVADNAGAPASAGATSAIATIPAAPAAAAIRWKSLRCRVIMDRPFGRRAGGAIGSAQDGTRRRETVAVLGRGARSCVGTATGGSLCAI